MNLYIYLYIVSTSMKIQVPTNHSWDPRLPSPRSRPNPGFSRLSWTPTIPKHLTKPPAEQKTSAAALRQHARCLKKTWITSNDNFFPTFRLVRIPFEAIKTSQIFEDWSLWPPSAQEFHQTCGFEHRVSPKLLYTSSWLCLTKKSP